MLSSASRVLILLAVLLMTTATSRRRPIYPRVGSDHQGSVYLHNARDATTAASIASLRPNADADCDRLAAGTDGGLQPKHFTFRHRWEIAPGENLPLHDTRLTKERRACHAVLIRIDERDWLLFWRDGAPASHRFAHTSRPGSPPTAGAVVVTRSKSGWQLRARSEVTVRALDRRRDRLARDQPIPGVQQPGAIDVRFHLDGRSASDGATLGDAKTLVTLGSRWRILFGDRGGAVTGVDFDMGSTNTGGLVTELNMYLLGLGLHNDFGAVGITGGGGLGWASGGRVPFAWQLPVEVFGSLKLGKHARVGARFRAQWVFDEDSRQSGSSRTPFGDEMRAGVSLYWIAIRNRGFSTGMGLSVSYSEQQGLEMWGLSLGSGMWHTP